MKTLLVYNYAIMIFVSILMYHIWIKLVVYKTRNVYVKLITVFIMLEAYNYLWRIGPYFTLMKIITRVR